MPLLSALFWGHGFSTGKVCHPPGAHRWPQVLVQQAPWKKETLEEGETMVLSFLGKLPKPMNEEVLKVMKTSGLTGL